MLIEISRIHIAPDRPPADPDSVQALADSIAEIGLINPITVDKENNLIAGLHRLQAANLLGWSEIECTVRDLTDLQAELAEIDENIIRRNLGTIDRGEKLLRRKEIYEALHPESKNGGDRRSENFRTKNFRSDSAKSFVQDTAEKIGVTPRTVEMQIQAAKKITPEAKQIIRDSNAKITQRDAIALSKLNADEQKEAAYRIAEGSTRNVPNFLRSRKNTNDTEQKPQEMQSSEDNEPPFKMITGHYATFAESVADLKNVDKDCSSSPDMFLAEFTSFVRQFLPQIQWYSKDYYMPVFPELTDKQMNYLRGQIEIMCSAAEDLYTLIERTRKNELPKKTRSAESGQNCNAGTGNNLPA